MSDKNSGNQNNSSDSEKTDHKKTNEEKLKDTFEQVKQKAEEVIDDPEEMKKIAESIWDKTKELKGPVRLVWSQLKLMVSLVKAWIKGEYTNKPVTSIIAIVISIVYFAAPIEIIPDAIPLIGRFDDLFLIAVAFTQIAKDLRVFAQWQEKQSIEQGTRQPEQDAST